ncbi:SNARE associated golgi family protein [Trypanosoma grayi]|uniref:SNARE associated golgi family protein n=1 Tax=Trypanosoma grayi TaxID=71804 RepID=UPI0004F41121|nr:SNARE associated golgi family protein [Trypanosoma grayi]KEG07685.1 SNARE associated golgi family protein [Trypanosoma grayi]
MEVNAEADSTTTFFVACLLIAMAVGGHIADRSGAPSHVIKVLLIVFGAAMLLLYITGTFGLMADLVGILKNSKTSLRSASGVAKFCKDVQELAATQLLQMLLLITVLYLFLQTLCVPGTVVLNAATGAVLGTLLGVPYCTLLGTVGASCCYLLSRLVGVRLVERADARLMKGKGLPKIRTQVSRYRSDLLVYLLFLRLTPILPNWLVNLASPVVGVPLCMFALATGIGIIPQTYLSVRFGALAHASTDGNSRIVTPWDTLLLAVLGVAVLGMFSLKKRFAAASGHDTGMRPSSLTHV